MKLTEQETAFVKQRSRLVRSWPVVGPICGVLVIGFTVWLWISRPLLVNPWEVLSRLKSASIQDSTMTLMAAMLPIVFLACIFLLLALIAICFLAFSNERKHLAIIQRLDADGADPGKNG